MQGFLHHCSLCLVPENAIFSCGKKQKPRKKKVGNPISIRRSHQGMGCPKYIIIQSLSYTVIEYHFFRHSNNKICVNKSKLHLNFFFHLILHCFSHFFFINKDLYVFSSKDSKMPQPFRVYYS